MFDNMNINLRRILLIVGVYTVTIGIAILIIAVSIASLVDTHRCSVMGRALLVLLGATAAIFLLSVIVIGIGAWKAVPSMAGRILVVSVYGVAMLVSYIGIAFGLLVAFNC